MSFFEREKGKSADVGEILNIEAGFQFFMCHKRKSLQFFSKGVGDGNSNFLESEKPKKNINM